jgi:hypothetical protein
VTHPFHPLTGRDFEFVAYRQNWGEDRVHLHDENGQLFSLPPAWTDAVVADPFVVVTQRANKLPPNRVGLRDPRGDRFELVDKGEGRVCGDAAAWAESFLHREFDRGAHRTTPLSRSARNAESSPRWK